MNQCVRRLFLVPVIHVLLVATAPAQTIFTIDGNGTSKEEFLKAFNKNNNGAKVSDKGYRDYLELYVRYKLKVRAAYEMQLDTLPGQRIELQNFRSQVAENYLKDDESIDKLTSEVFTRGQKDIRLAHIFISDASATDTAKAYEKAMSVYNALRKGKKFEEAAVQWSDDPAAKTNGGNVGYIAVFTLPYELESIAYGLTPGQISKPYRSKAGYHILKNLGERKSLGRIKAAQILVQLTPGSPAGTQTAVRIRADSIYNVLRRGADFSTLAKTLSGDNLTYQTGGEMAAFGVGKYDSAFEAAAFALDKDGAISAPVASAFGYHIIKRIAREPFPHQWTPEVAAALKARVQADTRAEVARKSMFRKIYQQIGLTRRDISYADLWAFTDSSILNAGLSSYKYLTLSTPVFSFSGQQYSAKEWLDYARMVKPARGAAGKPDPELFEQFIEKSALEYYRNHLEQYNRDFAFQLTEFKEGNLLFEIMQRKIWDKASTDSAGLHSYYESHKDKYWWEPSADAILFTCNNAVTAQAMRNNVVRDPRSWREFSDSAGANVQADSGRYELAQIPGLGTMAPAPHLLTPLTGKQNEPVSFAYILDVYRDRSLRSYKDARGFVINDYQTWLEDQWIAALKKKYPVRIEEQVIANLPR